MSWVLKPNIWKLIERNHEETRALTAATADILVGAGHVEIMKVWVRHQPKAAHQISRKETYEKMRWKGDLLRNILLALIRWNPSGSADPAYDLFSEISKEHFESIPESPYSHVPMGPSHTIIGKIMNRKLTASPESFDRCQMWREVPIYPQTLAMVR